MARPLRIEYQGAWYHVMNRGADRRLIYKSSIHRRMFLNLLEEITTKFFVEIHSFCLMNNHYHLLIRTPYSNLGRAMRHLNGVYTQRYNKSTNSDGPLFRGRYKAILIEEKEENILMVSRYIHLNPVKANICKSPQNYNWSSFRSFITNRKKHSWLYTDFILAQIGDVNRLIKFTNEDDQNDFEKFFSKKSLSTIFGSKSFVKMRIDALDKIKLKQSQSDLRRTQTLPSIELIMKGAANFFEVNLDSLKLSQRGIINLPRLLGIYICKYLGLHSNRDIASHFDNITTDGVASAIRRVKNMIIKHSSIDAYLKEITSYIKTQNQT